MALSFPADMCAHVSVCCPPPPECRFSWDACLGFPHPSSSIIPTRGPLISVYKASSLLTLEPHLQLPAAHSGLDLLTPGFTLCPPEFCLTQTWGLNITFPLPPPPPVLSTDFPTFFSPISSSLCEPLLCPAGLPGLVFSGPSFKWLSSSSSWMQA